jgi:tetratricopeptide (TPR) repeat protein
MKAWTLKRDIVFYPLVCGIWVLLIIAFHGGHNYFGTPLPGMTFPEGAFQAFRIKSIAASMEQLKKSVTMEADPRERAHSQENIGISYFDLYKSTRNPAFLDTAEYYLDLSLRVVNDVARFYYNLARIHSEKKNFMAAKEFYEKTIALEPRHFMAYHNLGILNYYELNRPDLAKAYFEKVTEIDPSIPIDNYMLAEISLDVKDEASAVRYYEKELGIFTSGADKRQLNLADGSSVQLAATLSAMQLAFLYSTTFKNLQLAQDRFNLYLKLETDPKRRQTSLAEIQKYWAVAPNKQNPFSR